MQKIMLVLAAALVVVAWNNSVEAASRLQVVGSAVPRVVESATKSLAKVGDEVASFFWRNKFAITTGTAVAVGASHPDLVVDGVVAVAAGSPIVVHDVGDYSVVQAKTDWIGYSVLGGLIGVLVLIVMYEMGGQARIVAKIAAVGLLFIAVIFFCGAARADELGGMVPDIVVPSIFNWRVLVEIVLILLTMIPICS